MTRHRLMPLHETGDRIQVGSDATLTPALADELAFLTGKDITSTLIPPTRLDAFLRSLDAEDSRTTTSIIQGSAVSAIDGLITEALDMGASDIHIEHMEEDVRIRYRLDGVLLSMATAHAAMRSALIARIKVMASLDIAEKRRPQDGRITYRHKGRDVDIRVSTLPTTHGEKVVLRLLDRSTLGMDIRGLGLGEEDKALLLGAISRPYGMVLVTGPTGSGKTTTLYAALSHINSEEVNITTIEDPAEYHLPGINQSHVRSDIGFTFSRALRAFLRQDPNIIMVGEVRDGETADIATRAALTGHLVLSTIHTNDAPSTPMRLIDMGVEPFLIASALKMVVAQRLVRKLCASCKEEAEPTPYEQATFDIADGTPLFAPRGCPSCRGAGYKGRTALFEVMPVTEDMAHLIAQRPSTQAIRECATRSGMRTLRQAARIKLLQGETSTKEVLRETIA